MQPRSPYTGPRRKLVLAFDVGTTYSGVSYRNVPSSLRQILINSSYVPSILDPGLVPEIRGVTRFPAQERVGGDCKIPSILYYDQYDVVRAAGAETLLGSVLAQKEEEQWFSCQWFKLHLRPRTPGSMEEIRDTIPALPESKNAVEVFADFLHYLFHCSRTYIEEMHGVGDNWWGSIEDTIEFVLSHPNGWEGAQQEQMRRATVLAGLVPNDEAGQARVSFVTEGEASLHFCIQSGLPAGAMKDNSGVLIVDAGGGTIDLSAYGCASGSADTFQEIAPPQCHFKGSIFVTFNARTYLDAHLRNSKYLEDVPQMADSFDKTTKLLFRNKHEPQYIRFGNLRDKDLAVGIRSGQLKLSGSDVASFFEPSVNCIVDAIAEQSQKARKPINSVFLVGGFAASNWLFAELKEACTQMGLSVLRPDSHVNKAVADGALSFYLDHSVRSRVSRFTYGTDCNTFYDGNDVEHLQRFTSFTALDGSRQIPGAFDVILPKNTQTSETKEFRRGYSQQTVSLSTLSQVAFNLDCYRGELASPRWRDIDAGMYSTLCTIEVDLSKLAHSLGPRQTKDGRVYYKVIYEIVLLFGLTELKAQLCWQENGVLKRTPAKLIYDPAS
ncbi:uncharacterized protein LACBIDRAFT_298123 [Laccaria bicolor S238N-H82]|uniref:Predicted protein n=1 Tax=Laccaria bicolor (strain S238N-H82 / ATCC MYA-4686) TaxID=486041 RepID=B0DCA9_LACBS|nr:uncharacterized protein LACBIDRAFT_298123 [Laccaria bicolor S238N-H82]EDR07866.1 predicted protein [Laccaria bicolor S238N-H82]|eukprot:XP_001881655.1 predicted protein [Laccaria bicolor S238N-H82]